MRLWIGLGLTVFVIILGDWIHILPRSVEVGLLAIGFMLILVSEIKNAVKEAIDESMPLLLSGLQESITHAIEESKE